MNTHEVRAGWAGAAGIAPVILILYLQPPLYYGKGPYSKWSTHLRQPTRVDWSPESAHLSIIPFVQFGWAVAGALGVRIRLHSGELGDAKFEISIGIDD